MIIAKMKLCLFVTLILTLHYVYAESVSVQLEQGTLSGLELKTVLNQKTYYSFKGIPYAQPPLGPLRFMAPQPPLPWDGVRNATEHGSICPQVNDLTNVYLPGSEDCLFLNIYTPNITPDSPLPVMFYIHGGAFKFGSGNDDTYGPDFLVEKGVVLVTINYRLDVLGLLCMDSKEVPGNMALKDQVAAMKWVNKNIDKFGGNPDIVTIFGQSAGGGSVTHHILSPMSKGYFKRAIAMSGSSLCDWTIPFEPEKRAFILGQILGYDTKNKTDLLNFLQNISYDKLINTKPTVLATENITNNILKMNPYVPVYEKDFGQELFLSDDPANILKTNNINHVDFMTGYTNLESLTILSIIEQSFVSLYKRYAEELVPTKILIKNNPDTILSISDKIHQYYFGDQIIDMTKVREMVYLTSNSSFVIDVHRFIRNLPNPGGNSRYLYKFSAYSKLNVYTSEGAKYDLYGTGHFDDLMYLFNAKSFNITIEENSIEYELIDKVTTLFTNFAKYGNPTPDSSLGIEWPVFDKETVPYMAIDNTLRTSTKPDEEHVQFWKSVLEDAGIDF